MCFSLEQKTNFHLGYSQKEMGGLDNGCTNTPILHLQ